MCYQHFGQERILPISSTKWDNSEGQELRQFLSVHELYQFQGESNRQQAIIGLNMFREWFKNAYQWTRFKDQNEKKWFVKVTVQLKFAKKKHCAGNLSQNLKKHCHLLV